MASNAKPRVLLVYGGTFSPPHCAHVELAKAAIDAVQIQFKCKVEHCILSPSHQGDPKPGKLPDKDRLSLTSIAAEESLDKRITCDSWAVCSPSRKDTVEEIQHYLSKYSCDAVFYVGGADWFIEKLARSKPETIQKLLNVVDGLAICERFTGGTPRVFDATNFINDLRVQAQDETLACPIVTFSLSEDHCGTSSSLVRLAIEHHNLVDLRRLTSPRVFDAIVADLDYWTGLVQSSNLAPQPTTPRDAISIRGMACRFPGESNNASSYWSNLYSGENLVDKDAEEDFTLADLIPLGKGVVANKDKFDHTFFTMNAVMASKTDPQLRFLLELSYEALADAGFDDIGYLSGTNTGVFIGSSSSDCHKALLSDIEHITGDEHLGCSSAMLANRISYFYDFRGPSENINTACSSSMVALHQACVAVERGDCDLALVGGSSIILDPAVSIAYKRLNMLSPDSACQAFSENANGYVRSEGVAVIVICKHNAAILKHCSIHSNSIANIVGHGVNSDGRSKGSITHPNTQAQKALYQHVYTSACVELNEVVYIEAHGSGTQAGDVNELEALHSSYVTPSRSTPLLVGSVKSNIGHTEAAAGLAGLIKVLLSYENSMLPANLHYTYETRNRNCTALENPQRGIRVVSNNEKFDGGVVGVSSMGFGGTNAHILVKGPCHDNRGCKRAQSVQSSEPWTYINPVFGRSQSTVEKLSAGLHTRNVRFSVSVSPPVVNGFEHVARAFTTRDGDVHTFLLARAKEQSQTPVGPIYLLFSGVGGNWSAMGASLYSSSTAFKTTWDLCSEHLLKEHNCSILATWFSSTTVKEENTVLSRSVSLTALQVCLVEVLKTMSIDVAGYVGHSSGEIAMGYIDGILTLPQAISTAFYRAECAEEARSSTKAAYGMIVVWVSTDIATRVVADCSTECASVVVACINDALCVTLSGEISQLSMVVEAIASEIKEKPRVKTLDSMGIAYHSPMFDPVMSRLQTYLSKLIPQPPPRSGKWLSSSCDDSVDADKLQGAEYLCVNFRNPVNFYDACSCIPSNAVVIEVGPHALFQSCIDNISKEQSKSWVYFPMMRRNDVSTKLLETLYGNLFFSNHVSALSKPESIHYFADRSVREAFIQWNHEQTFPIPNTWVPGIESRMQVTFDFDGADRYMLEHVIDGTAILPAAAMVYAVWKAYSTQAAQLHPDITINNLSLHSPVITQQSGTLKLFVQFLSSGDFELSQTDGERVASGSIRRNPPSSRGINNKCDSPDVDNESLSESTRLYHRLHRVGYSYGPNFRVLTQLDTSIDTSTSNNHVIKTPTNATEKKAFILHLDGVLQLSLFALIRDDLRIPSNVRQLVIRGSALNILCSDVQAYPTEEHYTHVTAKPLSNIVTSSLADVCGLHATLVKRESIHSRRGLVCGVESQIMLGASTISQRNLVPTVDEALATSTSYVRDQTDALSVTLPLRVLDFEPTQTSVFPTLAIKHVLLDPQVHLARFSSSTGCEEVPDIYLEHAVPSVSASIVPQGTRFNLIVIHKPFALPKSSSSATKPICLKYLEHGGYIFIVEETSQSSPPEEFELVMQFHVEDSEINSSLYKHIPSSSQEHHQHRQSSFHTIFNLTSDPGRDLFDRLKTIVGELQKTPSPEESVFVVSDCPGFSGCVKSVQLEPACHQIRGVVLVSRVADASGVPQQHVRQQIIRLNSKCVLFDEVKNQLSVHVLVPKLHELKFPAVHGRFLIFPNPGHVDDIRFQANPISLQRSSRTSQTTKCVRVMFAGLNFRDALLARDKIDKDALSLPLTLASNDGGWGLEFAGYDVENNQTVIGVSDTNNCMGTRIRVKSEFVWALSSDQQLKEFATVPVTYATAYYALIVRANLRPTSSVLIHCGAGGVGQAALYICLKRVSELGKVFVTCGNTEKKRYLVAKFGALGLQESNIGCSRDTSFFELVMQHTDGHGVDIVLNSLAGDMLHAGIECLAPFGIFCELGKHSSVISMASLQTNVSVIGVDIAHAMHCPKVWKRVWDMVNDGLKSGEIVPLDATVFEEPNFSKAFALMLSGEHRGKLLLGFHTAESGVESGAVADLADLADFPNVSFDGDNILIIGGLGGVGLELAKWLARHGATRLTLSTRRGITRELIASVVEEINAPLCEIVVCDADFTDYEVVKEWLQSNPITTFFNLGAIVDDGIFSKIPWTTWRSPIAVKQTITSNFDRACADGYTYLKCFVVFSSVVARLGNAGQSSYAMANSAMDDIVRKRVRCQTPGLHLSVQWGSIADVGLLGPMSNLTPTGVLTSLQPQRVQSCFLELEKLIALEASGVYGIHVLADNVARDDPRSSPRGSVLSLEISKLVGSSLMDTNTPEMLCLPLRDLGVESLQYYRIQDMVKNTVGIKIPLNKLSEMTLADFDLLDPATNHPTPAQTATSVSPSSTKQKHTTAFVVVAVVVADESEWWDKPAITSLLRQKYVPRNNIIVVSEGSCMPTLVPDSVHGVDATICHRLQNTRTPGRNGAVNTGILWASEQFGGESWVVIADPECTYDDLHLYQCGKAADGKVDLIIAGTVGEDVVDMDSLGIIDDLLDQTVQIHSSTMLIKTRLTVTAGLLDEAFTTSAHADTDLYIRLCDVSDTQTCTDILKPTVKFPAKGVGVLADTPNSDGLHLLYYKHGARLKRHRPLDMQGEKIWKKERAFLITCSGDTISLHRDTVDAVYNLENSDQVELPPPMLKVLVCIITNSKARVTHLMDDLKHAVDKYVLLIFANTDDAQLTRDLQDLLTSKSLEGCVILNTHPVVKAVVTEQHAHLQFPLPIAISTTVIQTVALKMTQTSSYDALVTLDDDVRLPMGWSIWNATRKSHADILLGRDIKTPPNATMMSMRTQMLDFLHGLDNKYFAAAHTDFNFKPKVLDNLHDQYYDLSSSRWDHLEMPHPVHFNTSCEADLVQECRHRIFVGDPLAREAVPTDVGPSTQRGGCMVLFPHTYHVLATEQVAPLVELAHNNTSNSRRSGSFWLRHLKNQGLTIEVKHELAVVHENIYDSVPTPSRFRDIVVLEMVGAVLCRGAGADRELFSNKRILSLACSVQRILGICKSLRKRHYFETVPALKEFVVEIESLFADDVWERDVVSVIRREVKRLDNWTASPQLLQWPLQTCLPRMQSCVSSPPNDYFRSSICEVAITSMPVPRPDNQDIVDGFFFFAYPPSNGVEICGLVKGSLRGETDVHVRIHSECLTGDVLGSAKCDCGDQKNNFILDMCGRDSGVLILIKGHEGRGAGLYNKICAYQRLDNNHSLHHHTALHAQGCEIDDRDYSLAVSAIQDLGVASIILHSNNPHKLAAVNRKIPCSPRRICSAVNKHNSKYLEEKQVHFESTPSDTLGNSGTHPHIEQPSNATLEVMTNETTFDVCDIQWVNFYDEHGWVVLNDTVDMSTLEKIKLQYHDIKVMCAKELGTPLPEYENEVTQHRDLFVKGGPLEDMIFNPKGVHSLAMKAMGWKGVRLFHDHIIAKPFGFSEKIPWHQDSMFWPVDLPGCSTWTAVEDVSVNGGCLEIIDRSHKHGCSSPVDFMAQEKLDATFSTSDLKIRLPAKAGSTVLLHSFTWHRSSPNENERSGNRPAHLALWVPADVRYRPDLVDWHPVNDQLKIDGILQGNRMAGTKHPMFGELELTAVPLIDIHTGTKREGDISMFDASTVVGAQLKQLMQILQPQWSDNNTRNILSQMHLNKDIQTQIVIATMEAGICVSTITQDKLEDALRRLSLGFASYEEHQARNVFNSAYANWWEIAGKEWRKRLKGSIEDVKLSNTEVDKFLKVITVHRPANNDLTVDFLREVIRGIFEKIPFQNFSMLTEELIKPSPQKIITDMLSGCGGLCSIRNPFLYLLLRACGFHVELLSVTLILGNESRSDAHIALKVSLPSSTAQYWVDVGNGHPYMEPISLGDLTVHTVHPTLTMKIEERGGRYWVCHQHPGSTEWTDNGNFSSTPVPSSTFDKMHEHHQPEKQWGLFLKGLRFNVWKASGGVVLRDHSAVTWNSRGEVEDTRDIQTAQQLATWISEQFPKSKTFLRRYDVARVWACWMMNRATSPPSISPPHMHSKG